MSPMIMAYTLTSGMRFELQQLKEAMTIRRDEDLLVTYLALKDHIDRVSNSSNQPTILSNMISNGAARSIVSKRLTMLDIEMTECTNLFSSFLRYRPATDDFLNSCHIRGPHTNMALRPRSSLR